MLVVALLLVYGFQALNTVTPWENPTEAGDVLDLGNGATAVPPVGWQLEDGSLVSSRSGVSPTQLSVKLAKGGAELDLRGAKFDGTATAFLDQVLSQLENDDAAAIAGARATFTTTAGLVGVVESVSGPGGDGLYAAFKMSTADAETAPALLFVAKAAPGQFEQYTDEIDAFLRSITPEARA